MVVMARLRAEVARRARYHCEYCGYPEAASSTPLEVDHIIPEARGGPTTFNNLALCCRRCNLHKHVQMEAVKTDTRGQGSSSARTSKRDDHPYIYANLWCGVPRIFLRAPLSSDAVTFPLSRGEPRLHYGKLATRYVIN